MFKNFFKINFIFFLFASISYAEIINDVDVAGNQRISEDTIIVLGSIQLKSDYSNEDLNVILKTQRLCMCQLFIVTIAIKT